MLIARLHGIGTIREYVSGAAVSLIRDLPFLCIFLAIMFFYSWLRSLITLAILAAIVVLSIAIVPAIRARIDEQFLLGARNTAFLTEYVSGVETVKSLQMEPQLAHAARDARPVEEQHRAHTRAYRDALGAEQALRARAEHDLGSATEIEAKLALTAPIYREQASAWDKLAREGFAGKLLALDRQRMHIEAEQELRAHRRNIESLSATVLTTRPLSELAYRARVRLAGDHIAADGRRLKLVPGMAVTAEVHIGRRTVLEYLLSPIRKVAAEAARER